MNTQPADHHIKRFVVLLPRNKLQAVPGRPLVPHHLRCAKGRAPVDACATPEATASKE